MIVCFKCGAPASIAASGIICYTCSCYPTGVTRFSTRCPLCGEIVYTLAYHICRGIGSASTTTTTNPVAALPAPTQTPEPEDQPGMSKEQTKRICQLLSAYIAWHKNICNGCKALGRSCFEISTFEKRLAKWQKKAEEML